MSTELEKILIIPDCHHPFVNKKAWNLLLRVGKEFKPKTIVTLGDFGDVYCVSSHRKNPNLPRLLEEEIESCNDALDQLDLLGAEYKYFLFGNHEQRLENFLSEKAPELFNVVKIEKLLNLSTRKWMSIPYRKVLTLGKMLFAHEVGYSGKNADMASMEAAQGNIIVGHCHRLMSNYSSNLKGETHVGITMGWLGDKNKLDYISDVQKRYWTLGFGIGYMESNGTMYVQTVPIINNKCVVEGKIFK